jgi:hypothetical protein
VQVFNEAKFGDRYVRLIQVSRKEMQATLALRFGGEGILKMKGIPFKAGPGEVLLDLGTGAVVCLCADSHTAVIIFPEEQPCLALFIGAEIHTLL